jgi:phospholipase C
MPRRRNLLVLATSAALLVSGAAVGTAAADPSSWWGHGGRTPTINGFKNVVVIYEENHSFDNLYGSWGSVNGQSVTGLSDAKQINTTQVTQDGDAYGCLLQDDVNLSAPDPVVTTCVDRAHHVPASGFVNTPFTIDAYIQPTDKTCPAPGVFAANGIKNPAGEPGGCTRDLVHRFYQEQYQLNGGLQNRYVTGSDAVGLTMGIYDTTQLPIYRYLHRRGHPTT